MKITVEGVGDVDISNREDYNDFLNSEGVKCVKVDGVRKSYGNLVNGGTYTLGPPIQQEQEPSDIKDLAAFARRAMDSETEKKDMSKASAEFALALLAGLSIETTVKLGEPQGTPGARTWFQNNFLAGTELEEIGFAIKVCTGALLPTLKAAGKQAKGKGGMVIGVEKWLNLADSVYEQAPGLIELNTDEYPIKVGQMILEITAFSKISRYGRGVVLMATNCNDKWRLVWFHDHNTIHRKNYSSARKCWMDFVFLLQRAETRGNEMQPAQKLVTIDEDEQDLDGFEPGDNKKQRAVDNEATLQLFANYLGDLYGERPVMPDWARAATTCPNYYM